MNTKHTSSIIAVSARNVRASSAAPITRRVLFPLVFTLLATAACGSLRERHAVPEDMVERAQIPGMPGVRLMYDLAGSPTETAALLALGEAVATALPAEGELAALTISGGGSNGAYGSGVLCAWSERGNRPTFQIVTGVSTGALMAPFAFLGPEHDKEMKELYTTITDADIYVERGLFGILGARDSLADTSHLLELVSKRIDRKKVDAIAAEHAKGRRLYVGTSNLDSERLVIWDMGAIASSKHEKALDLFHHVLVASASIPVAFPPVYFDVEVDGKAYEEMHCDGGVMTQVFGASMLAITTQAAAAKGKRVKGKPQLYVLRNARHAPVCAPTEGKLGSIAGRTVSTMVKTQGYGDLHRAYMVAQLTGLEYHATWIPLSFTRLPKTEFETEYMKELFDVGYKLARDGDPWAKQPPLVDIIEAARAKR